MGKVITMNHPLIQHKLTMLRDRRTGTKEFRELVTELSQLMAYEVTRDLETMEIEIETPICKTKAKTLANEKLAVIPILRAGLGMADGMMNMIPNAKIGHIGLYRDPDTLLPISYYAKLPPDVANRDVIIVDPMLATGNSAIEACGIVKKSGCKSLRLVVLIAAPEGIEAMQTAHPDVDLYIGNVDERLNEHGYIIPGLGDAGDRLFGTK